jgi:hypothetical protein
MVAKGALDRCVRPAVGAQAPPCLLAKHPHLETLFFLPPPCRNLAKCIVELYQLPRVRNVAALSALLGMAGGMVFMAGLTLLLPVPTAMVLHGATQLISNGSRALLLGRNLRAQSNIPSNKRVPFVIRPAVPLPQEELDILKGLLNAEALTLAAADWQAPKGTPVAANAVGELFLPLAGLVDVEAERARQEKELAKVRSEIQKVQDKLANPAFTQKVPASVLAEHQQRLIDWQAKEKQILSTLQ